MHTATQAQNVCTPSIVCYCYQILIVHQREATTTAKKMCITFTLDNVYYGKHAETDTYYYSSQYCTYIHDVYSTSISDNKYRTNKKNTNNNIAITNTQTHIDT